jgi:hypothetical protein
MPRYFFNVGDGKDLPDLGGQELRDLKAAQTEAVRFAGALLREHGEKFWKGTARSSGTARTGTWRSRTRTGSSCSGST